MSGRDYYYNSSNNNNYNNSGYRRNDRPPYHSDSYYHSSSSSSYHNNNYQSSYDSRDSGYYRSNHHHQQPPSSSSPSSSYATPSSEASNESNSRSYDNSSPSRSPTQSNSGPKIREMSYEERVSTFKKMLDDCKVQTDDDWSRAMKRVGNDPRVKLIKRIQERKDIFQQYISEKINKEREAGREKRRKLREDFMTMLAELKSTVFSHPKSYLTTTYQQVLPKIENDHRFLNVESEDDRLDYFYTFLDDLERKDKDSIKQERKKNMAKFHDLLTKKKEQGLITYRSLWRQIREKIQSEEEYKALDYCDRLLVWEGFISDLELEHYNKKKQRREEKERLIKQQVDNFWNFLTELKKERKLNVLTGWKEVKTLIENDERYICIANQTVEIPSSPTRYNEPPKPPRIIEKPKMIFNDYIEHLLDLYKQDKKTFRKLIKEIPIEIDENSTFENFKAQLEKDERSQTIDPDNVHILFEEAVDKAKDKKRKRSSSEQEQGGPPFEQVPQYYENNPPLKHSKNV